MKSVRANLCSRFTLVSSLILTVLFLTASPYFAKASSSDGTINSSNRYAWSEADSWIDFGSSQGNVHVTDSSLTGYAWSAEFGWISLNCSNDNSCNDVNYSVTNDGNGHLSGYAYGETTGWISFNPTYGGVVIDSSGNFSGYAWSDQIGWIVFNCLTTESCDAVGYKVATDWRPLSARSSTPVPPTTSNSSSVSSSGGSGYVMVRQADGSYLPVAPSLAPLVAPAINATQPASLGSLPSRIINAIIPEFLKPSKSEPAVTPVVSDLTPKETPLVMSGNWDLLSQKAINTFVLAPLPKEILTLTAKFPELGKTFKTLGINTMNDLNKLKDSKFTLPGLSQEVGINGASVFVASLTPEQKMLVPTNVVFAKSGVIDYGVSLDLSNGVPEERVNTIVGKTLDLAIKADKPVNSIIGYVLVKNIQRQAAVNTVPSDSMLASVLAAIMPITHLANSPAQIEQKLVLQTFTYNDENKDGIYTASIQAPQVDGEYDIVSIMEYKDIKLGSKEFHLTAVVDPEGYVYKDAGGGDETRIHDAKVTIMTKNSKTSDFEIWPAKDFQQTNPQLTGKDGTYSFLVPDGIYKLTVTGAGYYDYNGDEFTVNQGIGIHANIKLQAKSWWKGLLGL